MNLNLKVKTISKSIFRGSLAIFAVTAAGVGALALATSKEPPKPRSFREVRDLIYSHPQTYAPHYEGFSFGDLAKAAIGHGNLASRARWTLSTSDDFKPRGVKLLHPMGVCAEARWVIDAPSPASGLLARGTEVRAIVRMSNADSNEVWSEKTPRIFGLAVKLFPTSNEDEQVVTRNLFNLDQNSLSGGKRKSYLHVDSWDGHSKSDEIHFVNSAPAKTFVEKKATKIFGKFDFHPDRRPLYQLTEVTASNEDVVAPVTPEFLHFVPRPLGTREFQPDFRDNLMQYKEGEIAFDIVIPGGQDAPFAQETRVGTLTLGQPVLSEVCDLELHFHHHPFNRALGI
jgi:hypothetical protein